MQSKKICITSLNYDNYKPLSDITWRNKVEYANRHSYSFYHHTEDKMINDGLVLGFEKIRYILNMLKTNKYEWIWFVGCDTLITNFNKKIESVISLAKKNESFIVATDCNGINMDSFLVKNSPDGIMLMEECFKSHLELNDKWCYEQKWFWDNQEKYKSIIKLVLQRTFNSYLCKRLYPNQSPMDTFGQSGEFERGDFLIHFPGMSLKNRLRLVAMFEPLIVK